MLWEQVGVLLNVLGVELHLYLAPLRWDLGFGELEGVPGSGLAFGPLHLAVIEQEMSPRGVEVAAQVGPLWVSVLVSGCWHWPSAWVEGGALGVQVGPGHLSAGWFS